MGSLSGRRAIVTGAALGLGRQYAQALAEAGCDVAVCDVRPEIEDVAAELARTGVRAIGFVADVSAPADVRRVVDGAAAAFGGIDVLINNAGIVRASLASDDLDAALAGYDAQMSVNFKGTFLFGRAVMPHMIAGGGGDIVNIVTDHVHPQTGRATGKGPLMEMYDISKWGQFGLTVAWARDLKAHGIRVNGFCMDATDSHMIRSFYKEVAKAEPGPDIVAGWMKTRAVCELAVTLIAEGPGGRTGETIGVWLDHEMELAPVPRLRPAMAKVQ